MTPETGTIGPFLYATTSYFFKLRKNFSAEKNNIFLFTIAPGCMEKILEEQTAEKTRQQGCVREKGLNGNKKGICAWFTSG